MRPPISIYFLDSTICKNALRAPSDGNPGQQKNLHEGEHIRGPKGREAARFPTELLSCEESSGDDASGAEDAECSACGQLSCACTCDDYAPEDYARSIVAESITAEDDYVRARRALGISSDNCFVCGCEPCLCP